MLEGGIIGDIGIGVSGGEGWYAAAAHSTDDSGVEKIVGRGEVVGEGVGGIVVVAHFVGDGCWVATVAVVVGDIVVGVVVVFSR